MVVHSKLRGDTEVIHLTAALAGSELTCPSNLRALPDTSGFPRRTHASLSRYLCERPQSPTQ